MIHFRSSDSAEERSRRLERRGWGSLVVCGAVGMAAFGLAVNIHPLSRDRAGAVAPLGAVWVEAVWPAMECGTVSECPPMPLNPRFLPQLEPEFPAFVPADVFDLDAPEAPQLCAVAERESADSPLPSPPESLDTPPPPASTAPAKPRKEHAAKSVVSARPAPASTPQGREAAGVVPPAYKSAPEPPYPASLRASRAEGDVRVRIAVDAEGRPSKVEIIASSGYREFDETTRDWVLRHWRFTPASSEGKNIPGIVTTTVRYVIPR